MPLAGKEERDELEINENISLGNVPGVTEISHSSRRKASWRGGLTMSE